MIATVFRHLLRNMGAPFSPTRQDVERYQRFRALSVELNDRIVKTIPHQAYDDIGDALCMRHNGIMILDSEDMMSVLKDCCLYDWHENGKNLVQRYAAAHAATPGTDKSYLLQACLQAKFRILLPQSAVPGAGLHCRDILNGEELFLMDRTFSQSVPCGAMALATRTIPLGEFWMTGGAALPIDSGTDVEAAMQQINCGPREFEDSALIALSVIRACLAAGASERITYTVPERPRKPRSGFKRRRR